MSLVAAFSTKSSVVGATPIKELTPVFFGGRLVQRRGRPAGWQAQSERMVSWRFSCFSVHPTSRLPQCSSRDCTYEGILVGSSFPSPDGFRSGPRKTRCRSTPLHRLAFATGTRSACKTVLHCPSPGLTSDITIRHGSCFGCCRPYSWISTIWGPLFVPRCVRHKTEEML
jgi:hypothetical protein